jgi:mono/diheme cytochrome c family protein
MPAGLLLSREAEASGRVIFAANCAICHGVNGDGRGLRREGMTPLPADLTLLSWSDEAEATRTYRVIKYGITGSSMPSWPMLGDRQIWDVVAYVHSLKAH